MAATNFDNDVRRGDGEALGVHSTSRKIGKAMAQQQQRKPVIIYMVSPKIIHVEAHEFLPLVQRLTGPDATTGGGGRTKQRASSSSSGRASGKPPGERKADKAGVPVRVKARALNRHGPAVSVSVSATRPATTSTTAAAPSSFLFHDLSPTLRGGAVKGDGSLTSPSWLHHSSDLFLNPGAPPLGSPSSFLDIFGPLPSQHQ